ncbi:malonate decarboxylase holo-ACP synthase [Streptomyces sp. NPDC058401]|uniref:malonate decarboxylase holo-ACP synthase n=1 Tax=Streptomyces sp. NPDC058401 TaxID=3346480 RepID=UPI0036555FE4
MTGPSLVVGGPRPHDLLRITDPARVLPIDPAADRTALRAALERAPWVVVRRDVRDREFLPVGVRGATRSLRWAARVPRTAVAEVLTPANLLDRARPVPRDLPVFHALAALPGPARPAWVRAWGPGGSAAFELAAAVATATRSSDLDLVADVPAPVPPGEAARLLAVLARLPVRIDLQFQTPYGGIAAAELARGEAQVLLRTDLGPFLVSDPWAPPPPAMPMPTPEHR